jgi:drug/metabolite transporter (DMT)-like permease
MPLGAAFFWGLNPIVMKIGLAELSPLPFNTLRLALGMLFTGLLTLAVPSFRRNWQRVRRSDIPRFALISLAGFFVFQLGYSFGVDYTSASVAAIILGTLPINVAILNGLSGLERPGRLKLLGIAATFLGVVFIALGRHGGISLAGTYFFGVLLMVGAEFAYGGYTVFVKPLTARYPIDQIIYIIISISFLFFLLLNLSILGTAPFSGLSPSTWLSCAASGMLALSAGNILWSQGVKRLGSTNTSVFGNLPPIFGIIAGILLLGETLSLLQLAGAAVILGGVALVNARPAGFATGTASGNSSGDHRSAGGEEHN